MEFYDVVGHVLELLQRQKRVSYRALKRQFSIDDDFLEDLKEEFLYAHESSVQADDRGFTWTGETEEIPVTTSQPDQPEPQSVVEQVQPVQETPSPVEPHTSEAERRQLTVMFVDLVGSTRLSSELDPEDLREIVREYQRSCTDVITKYDGTVAQLLGDGLLVYFGYPVAHEDDAQRTVHSGLGIIETIGSLNTRLEQNQGIKLAIRIGIHTGLVVVGEMGSGKRQEQLALGETPNISSRIQGLAEPDTLIVSDATYRLIQGYFDCESLGEHVLRGVSQPIVVYRVLGDTGVQSRLDVASIRGLTPLVGRESESTLLFERWAQSKDGNGQVILLSGEAGIGKSRLIQVLKDHIADEPHTRMECRSLPYFTNSALYPIMDMIQRTLQFQTDDTSEQKLEKLEHNLRQYRLPLEETVPLFASLLSLPVPEDRYPPLTLSPQRQREKTLEAIVAITLELSEQQPVLFILEDLHWVDPTTLELLELLVDQTPTASVYTLLTCRPEFQPSWSHRSYLTEVTVNRLSSNQIARMAEHVVGGKGLPTEIIQQLVDKTDGVPLYVEEMTKSVLESWVLKETNGHYELADSISTLSIPTTLQDSLMARLDRLVTAKAVAQYASVIGRQFSYELLHAVAQLDEATLQRELGRLVEAELAYQRGLPPQATYTFKHALIQDTAYESLLRSTRQGYHRRIAEVLAEQFPETAETQPELVAHHYIEAGINEQAVAYWRQAGEQAVQRSAYLETIGHLSNGLDTLNKLPCTRERDQYELQLQLSLALAFHASKGQSADEVEYTYLRARELCEQLDEGQQLFRVLMGLYRCYGGRGQRQTAREFVDELFRVAQRLQDAPLLLEAHMARGVVIFHAGEFIVARDHLEQAIAIYDPEDKRFNAANASINPGVNVLSRMSWTLWFLGYPEQARSKSQETLTLARQLGHIHSLAMVCTFASILHLLCGEGDSIQEQVEVATRLSSEYDFRQWKMMAAMLRGWYLAHHEQSEVGIVKMQEELSTYLASGNALYRVWFLALLAEAYGQYGRSALGLEVIGEALALVFGNEGERCWESELHHIKGKLLLEESPDNAADAESCFQQAITIAQNQSAKSWELRAATSLARLWQSQGKRKEAYNLLSPVYGWFTEGFDTADLIDARALLDELS